jgi:hypothetical protein
VCSLDPETLYDPVPEALYDLYRKMACGIEPEILSDRQIICNHDPEVRSDVDLETLSGFDL